MSDDVTEEMVEIVAEAIWNAWQNGQSITDAARGISWRTVVECAPDGNKAAMHWLADARSEALAAIRAVAPLIAAAEREACAKVADERVTVWGTSHHEKPEHVRYDAVASVCSNIASAIRSRGEGG